MGIFGGGYTAPGKGVDKNEPKKKGFFLFFDIIVHKFMKILGANCLYALTSILWLLILMFFGRIVVTGTGIAEAMSNRIISLNSLDSSFTAEEIQGSVSVFLELLFAVGVFSLWGSGPASAAYAYINRCFTRGEHAWIVSDGKDKFKENFKQGMVVVLIDAVFLFFGLNAIYFYHSMYVNSQSAEFLWLILIYVLILAFVVYTMMHPYLYQIMVTFDCKIGALYKNALLISIAKLPVNLILTAVCSGIILLIFQFISNPVISALLLLIFGLAFTCYPRDFYAARVIERSILKDMKAKQAKIEYIDDNTEIEEEK